ncbi:MAG: ABC transporter ATP-binding protein [Bacillota bacterium]|nr:ABC transporter ATP-binding protein [Bacillota bacterium]
MLLEMKNISKSYANVLANDNISLDLKEGEILSIVGENGAGKSTIMKILYGMESKDSGQILIRGKEVNIKNPRDAIKNGIGMVQQHFMLFNPFKVFENIVFGEEPNKGIFFDRQKAKKEVEALSEKYGLKINPNQKVEDCPVGIQQRIEILKVLYQNAEIIIFDEPSAVLTPQEVDELLITIKELSKAGKSIILITHKLNEVMAVSDRIFIMRQGKHIATFNKEDTSIEEISYLMVGKKLSEKEIPEIERGPLVLDVEDLKLKHKEEVFLDGLSMKIYGGEIVGIAGVSGNGQSELIEVLTGLKNASSGKVSILGKDVLNKSVDEIRSAGLAVIPEDRYFWGCAKDADLRETSIMNHHKMERFSKNGLLKNKEIEAFVVDLLEKYDVRHGSLDQRAGQLSGGNIQKLIVGRELEQNSKFLLAAEPTRGVDIGAMEEIHKKLLEKRAKGDAVLLISSELTEILTLSDRIYTIYEGKFNGEFTRQEADSEKIGLLMMGGKKVD